MNQNNVNLNVNQTNVNLNLNQIKQCEPKGESKQCDSPCESNKRESKWESNKCESKHESNNSPLTQIDSLKPVVQTSHMTKVCRITISLVICLELQINTTHCSQFCQRGNSRIFRDPGAVRRYRRVVRGDLMRFLKERKRLLVLSVLSNEPCGKKKECQCV